MTNTTSITALPVLRDDTGCWTHPDFFAPVNESGPALEAEFKAWLKQYRLRSASSWMENEVTDEMMAAYDNGLTDISAWQPVPPGAAWFVGSIHDTQAGPVCIWLCNLTGKDAAP